MVEYVSVRDCYADRERREQAYEEWATFLTRPNKARFDCIVYEIGLREVERRLAHEKEREKIPI